jgi:hypothetical protein
MSESLYEFGTSRLTLYNVITPNCCNFRGATSESFGEAWLYFKNVSTGGSSRVSYLLRSVAL